MPMTNGNGRRVDYPFAAEAAVWARKSRAFARRLL
jgi:hypothetical protein